MPKKTVPNFAEIAPQPQPKPWEVAPAGWSGTDTEWAIYWACGKLKLVEGRDFIFQSPFLGGRSAQGGAIIDFYFPDRSIGIRVQGNYFHYQYNPGYTTSFDRLQRVALEGQGIRVVDIDGDYALQNPVRALSDALKGISHTRSQ